MFSRLVVRIEIIRVLCIPKEFQNLPNVFAYLISSTYEYVFARSRRLDYKFSGVCTPMKECSIQGHCVGAGALSGVHLSSKINVRETGWCNLFTLVGVFSRLCDFICVCDAIKCVVIVNVIFCCDVCMFSSGWWRMIVLHERVRKMEVGMFSSMCIDKCLVDNFVCDDCWFV